MRVLNKTLGTVAAIAMFAGTTTAAYAFDEVDWSWNKDVEELVDIDIVINDEFDPTGLTQIEKLQIQVGDVTATSSVDGITNNQPNDAGGVASVDETFTFTGNYDGPPTDNVVGLPLAAAGGVELDAHVTAGTIDENMEAFEFEVQVTGDVAVDPADSFDATTELPTIESAATAVGNNQTINSEVATMLHDGQILFDVGPGDPANEDDFGVEDIVGVLGGVVAAGVLSDNTHTAAVGNNISVNVNGDGNEGDSILIADMTQFAAADISAMSKVNAIEVNNYNSLGLVDPLVSSAATAVGNNVSINVGNVAGN